MRRKIDQIVSPEALKHRTHAAPGRENSRDRDPLSAKLHEAQRHTRTHRATSPRARGR
jgi:hypothetical protein